MADYKIKDAKTASLDEIYFDRNIGKMCYKNALGIITTLATGNTTVQSVVAGTNVNVDNTDPTNPIVNATGGGSNIGKLIGGGIVVDEWNESGVNKALVTSLTNLSVGLIWTPAAFIGTLIGATAQSYSDGLTNTNAIIAQTGAAATTAYAAGIARLFAGGGFSDWYLPSQWELNTCYNSAAIVNKILGSTNGFITNNYWSSTENSLNSAFRLGFNDSGQFALNKGTNCFVRAVRIHTI